MADLTTECSEDNSIQSKRHFNPKVRWMIPQIINSMTFVGKDVFAVANDLYIMFINLKTQTELVYVANSTEKGDGVDCISGQRTTIFAFAEKRAEPKPRIFIMVYPSFLKLAELSDSEVVRYKGICMMESDLISGFSGFPNYVITVWSWRTGQRLLCLPTGVLRRRQIYMASHSHTLVCQCWGEGLIVWDVNQCFRHCLMLRRAKEELQTWEHTDPPLGEVCWTPDGLLYAIDARADLYCMSSDGIGMVPSLEWSGELTGERPPRLCALAAGLLIYGPDDYLRYIKKVNGKWSVSDAQLPPDAVHRLVSNWSSDCAVLWSETGLVCKLTLDADDKLLFTLLAFKQRNITRIRMIAPEFDYLAALDSSGVLCIYKISSGEMMSRHVVDALDIDVKESPADPLLVVLGEVGANYGLLLLAWSEADGLVEVGRQCLTHQIVSRVTFSMDGRYMVAAAMSAGHIFVYKVSAEYQLELTRYAELGRGLADVCLMKVGDTWRSFNLVLFSDKYAIGERIMVINAETGKDNKFAGKMQGPYTSLLPLAVKDTMLAIPHFSRQLHVLKMSGEKGITVTVKIADIIDSAHDIKYYKGFYNTSALLTFGYEGKVIMRLSHDYNDIQLQLPVSHRYNAGVALAATDAYREVLATLSLQGDVLVQYLDDEGAQPTRLLPPDPAGWGARPDLTLIRLTDKNYLDLQEDKKVYEESLDYKQQRSDVVKSFLQIQGKLVALLEENLVEPPLHQLSLSEFNLHQEHKKERYKQAEREREEIRLKTEALIRGQNKVAEWIKVNCWDKMLTQRVKLLAIFSHYQVENYPVLPVQRDSWPELQRTLALRDVELDLEDDVFRPWEEESPADLAREKSVEVAAPEPTPPETSKSKLELDSSDALASAELSALASLAPLSQPYVLSGTDAHRFIKIPREMTPQTLAFSFLHESYLHQLVKLNNQNMRQWFNKQFDDLMGQKKREVGLVEERNARLRFIIEELNKLSDLRGSFHHLNMLIRDPQWSQDEQPERLIKVDPEECSIEPYISPSQIVLAPPEPQPKDDFKERALIDMMDGVLEKLWHEEIKKPIPKPLCMLEKDPENLNEEELRLVFEYEAKVQFRREERDKYRKMLHAEYGKLSTILNEGIVKFNNKVKELWLMKLRVDSVIGQESLNRMRLRRVNLDRAEMAEKLEDMRETIKKLESEVVTLTEEHRLIQSQSDECQTMYDSLAMKDKYMERTFKNHFADLSVIIVDQCFKYYKRRPKWHQRASMIPSVLYELAAAVLAELRPPLLHPDCLDYCRAVDQLDQISNMPAVMDEDLWSTMVKLRRAKIDNEIRMRAVILETAYVDGSARVWQAAVTSRRTALARVHDQITTHREDTEILARNKTIQLVLPAGQVEIVTTGHFEDYDDAALIPIEDIEAINNLILRVGEMKLKMMKKQMEFRRGILAKEWEHAQMKMKLRHMKAELYSYKRLKIPKELQLYLKEKTLGYTEEKDYIRLEKEMEASKMSINRILSDHIQKVEDIQIIVESVEAQSAKVSALIGQLNEKVSEKRLKEDPFEPLRVRRDLKNRMDILVQRSKLIREVQSNHTKIILLQTELELLRLKTYPTLASIRTLP